MSATTINKAQKGLVKKMAGALLGAKGVARTFLPSYLSIAVQLVKWGYTRREAQRLMELVTSPVYGGGSGSEILSYAEKVAPGAFPFPRGLYEALMRPGKLPLKKMQVFYSGMHQVDKDLFEMTYVPIKYVSMTRTMRAHVNAYMKRLGIKSYDRAIVAGRLSQRDIFSEDAQSLLVYSAIHMPSASNNPRTKEWVAFYAIYRGLGCATASKRDACLQERLKTLVPLIKGARNAAKGRKRKAHAGSPLRASPHTE